MPTKDEVLALTEQVGNLATQVHGEREAKKWAVRLLAIALLIVAFIAVRSQAAANDAQRAAEKAQDAVDQVIAQRTESRQATCGLNTVFAKAHNKLVIGIVTSAGTREIPPSLQDDVDAQLVPVPDCTPKGIRDFYEGDKP